MYYRAVARFRMRVALLGVLAVCSSGCAGLTRGGDACWTKKCLRQDAAAEEEQRRVAAAWARRDARLARDRKVKECRESLRDPDADKDAKRACARWLPRLFYTERQERWRASGIHCADKRSGEGRVEVSCTLPVSSGSDADFLTASEKSLQLAAFAALGAGKAYIIFAGSEQIEGRIAESTAPVRCEESRGEVSRLGLALQAMSESLQPTATTQCRPGLLGTDCETYVHTPPPRPSPRIECTGGNVVRTLTSIKTRDYYDLLGEEDAAQRENDLLPAERRPMRADKTARTFEEPRETVQ